MIVRRIQQFEGVADVLLSLIPDQMTALGVDVRAVTAVISERASARGSASSRFAFRTSMPSRPVW